MTIPRFNEEIIADMTSDRFHISFKSGDQQNMLMVVPATKFSYSERCLIEVCDRFHPEPPPKCIQSHCELSEYCIYATGDCSGTQLFWWQRWPHQQCIAMEGAQQCTSGWNQYPWITKCWIGKRPGTITQGVGFCLW
jgi:hypothetical protein